MSGSGRWAEPGTERTEDEKQQRAYMEVMEGQCVGGVCVSLCC